MTGASRVPPRFVPTLTTVVELPPEAAARLPEAGETAAPAPDPLPPVEPPAAQPLQPSPLQPQHALVALSETDAFQLEEELLHRVLQRVDLSLEDRLSDVVAAAVQQQLDAMVPRLRGEIEHVLRTLVVEALAQELSENPGSAPGSDPQSFG